jgi:hypothetical protein
VGNSKFKVQNAKCKMQNAGFQDKCENLAHTATESAKREQVSFCSKINNSKP